MIPFEKWMIDDDDAIEGATAISLVLCALAVPLLVIGGFIVAGLAICHGQEVEEVWHGDEHVYVIHDEDGRAHILKEIEDD